MRGRAIIIMYGWSYHSSSISPREQKLQDYERQWKIRSTVIYIQVFALNKKFSKKTFCQNIYIGHPITQPRYAHVCVE